MTGDIPRYTQHHGNGRLGELLSKVRLVVFDFDGVFTDNVVYVDESGKESVSSWRSDGIGLSRLRSVGIEAQIISTEVNPVVSMRARKLKVACKQGVDDKAATLVEYCREMSIDLARTAFVGNDINDIPAFKVVGLPIAVGDAYPEVFPHVIYRTARFGGRGAVREVCDLLFSVACSRDELTAGA